MKHESQTSPLDDLHADWRPFTIAAVSTPLSGQVHLYLTRSTTTPEAIARCRALLTDEERQRVDRLIIPTKRVERTISRAFLRAILSRYLNTPPADIPLTKLPDGKPILDSNTLDLTFNTSHAADLIIVAVTSGQPIGIDIEKIRNPKNMTRIANQYFAPDEIERLTDTPEPDRPRVFSTIWTRKEAIVKATGHGLRTPTSAFSTLTPQVIISGDNKYVINNINISNDILSSLAAPASLTITQQTVVFPEKLPF